ncbi:cation:proton antiporter domain-containing protein [Solimonas soli]|uniref:cation:proton antiporter domain-containing protein n=1 Tax=Solimonas soli TaxID=413479 RepID=UPI0004848C21|nr:cation:proton antiporter [Solimonas soli]
MSGAGEFYLAALIVSLVLLFLGAASGVVNNRLWLSEPMLCVIVGMLTGPLGFGWLDETTRRPASGGATVEAARFALAIAVVGAALRLPSGYLRRCWRELALILLPGMLLVWLIGAGLAMLLLQWQALPALLLAAALAPTDPVLAASIINGRFASRVVPERLRNTISAESGANDGFALPLLLVPAALLTHGGDADAAWTMWWQTVAHEIAVALVVGTFTGYLSGRLLQWASHHREAEMTSLVTLALALAVATMTACRLLGTDGILACFVAGAWLNEALRDNEQERHDRFHQAISRFFELPFFVFFGALLPWAQWREFGARGVLFALLLIFVRRPLAWLLLGRWLPSLATRRDRLFAGWFGPIGIAAVFYALQWGGRLDLPRLWPAVSLVALVSLLLHGTTATPLSRVLVGDERRAARGRR